MNFKKLSLSFLLIFFHLSSFSQDVVHDFSGKYLDANKIISSNIGGSDETPVDVMYQYLVPQYEENQDPKRSPVVEVYFGEVYHNDRTDETLKWLKRQLLDDYQTEKHFKSELTLVSKHGHSLKNDSQTQDFIKKVTIPEMRVSYDQIPEDIKFEQEKELTSSVLEIYKDKADRAPAARMNPRVFWTLVRVTTGAGGTVASLYFAQDLSPALAIAIGVWPGLASGAITYFSGGYGSWLSSGKWSKWLLESKNSFTDKLRKSFKIDESSLAKLGKDKLAKVMSRLHSSEEYLKWYITEVAFTAGAIKIPQAIGGVGAAAGLMSSASDVLIGSTMGMLAQGPGDIAIQLRKYQKVAELKDKILKGVVKVENQAQLLEEIEAIISKTKTISDNSHVALRKIENWARSRATMLSFFSVIGVGMEIAGVPLSRPILLSIGVGGAFYYGQVQGAFTEKTKLGKGLQKFIKPFKEGFETVKTVVTRTCNNIYRKRPN